MIRILQRGSVDVGLLESDQWSFLPNSCSLFTLVFPVSGSCLGQRNHLSVYSLYPLGTSGSHSRGCTIFQLLLLDQLYWTSGFSIILFCFLLNNCLCSEEASLGLFLPILSAATKKGYTPRGALVTDTRETNQGCQQLQMQKRAACPPLTLFIWTSVCLSVT